METSLCRIPFWNLKLACLSHVLCGPTTCTVKGIFASCSDAMFCPTVPVISVVFIIYWSSFVLFTPLIGLWGLQYVPLSETANPFRLHCQRVSKTQRGSMTNDYPLTPVQHTVATTNALVLWVWIRVGCWPNSIKWHWLNHYQVLIHLKSIATNWQQLIVNDMTVIRYLTNTLGKEPTHSLLLRSALV